MTLTLLFSGVDRKIEQTTNCIKTLSYQVDCPSINAVNLNEYHKPEIISKLIRSVLHKKRTRDPDDILPVSNDGQGWTNLFMCVVVVDTGKNEFYFLFA